MKNAKQLREERDAKLTAARALTDAAKAAKRELSADEATQFDAFMDEAETLATDITRAVRAESAAAEQAGKTPAINSHNTSEARSIGTYSMIKAVRSAMPGAAPLEGIEKEMHQEAVREAHAMGGSIEGVGVPAMMLTRDNSMTMPTQPADGSAILQKDVQSPLDLLRPRTALRALGVTYLTGLQGNISIPTLNSGAVSTWAPEVGALVKSNQTFTAADMSPKRLGTEVFRSKQFLLQTAPSVNNMLQQDIINSILEEVERAAINGSGTANQPLGLLNNALVAVVAAGANGAVPTRELLIALEAAVEDNNISASTLGYLINVATKAKLRGTRLDAGSGLFVMESNSELMGYPVQVTNLVPRNLTKGTTTGTLSAAAFGNWSDMLIGQWGGLDITVDPYTVASLGQIKIVVQSYWDVLVQRPKAFAIAKDFVTV